MAIEESMNKLAAAMDKLADSYDRYNANLAKALEKGVAFIGAQEGTAAKSEKTDKPAADDKAEAPKKRGRKSKAEKEAEAKAESQTSEDDGLGDDDDLGDDDGLGDDDDDDGLSASEVAAEDIKKLLMKVKDEKGVDKARSILADLGVKTIANIPEKDFPRVIAMAKKMGVAL